MSWIWGGSIYADVLTKCINFLDLKTNDVLLVGLKFCTHLIGSLRAQKTRSEFWSVKSSFFIRMSVGFVVLDDRMEVLFPVETDLLYTCIQV